MIKYKIKKFERIRQIYIVTICKPDKWVLDVTATTTVYSLGCSVEIRLGATSRDRSEML